jgi:predicted MPP superfamily phosphohydrolase
MLSFPDENAFYFLQILKRRKDNPDLGKDMVHIADYYIYSLDQFDELKRKIINQCNAENARAYFRLNRRDSKKVAMQVLKRTVDYITSKNYNAVKNVFASCTGESHSDPDKTWIVDIDNVSLDFFNHSDKYNSVRELVFELQKEAGKEPMMTYIFTKGGIHIITRPFNLNKFREQHPDVDVHKDNPTILYCP